VKEAATGLTVESELIKERQMSFLTILMGFIIGSFLNVIIYRIPRGESIVFPPSHCPFCQHRLGFWDLLPVFSYLRLKGRCRYCRNRISLRYPLVELLAGVMTFIWWRRIGLSADGISLLILTYALIAIALIDAEHQIIPNKITYSLILFGLVIRWMQGEWLAALIGGLVGGGILFLIALIYPKGMGIGDVKFLAMAGVFLGWYNAIWVLLLGSVLGTVVMLPLLWLRKMDRKTPFAFGPFLVVATLLIIYCKDWFWFLT